MDLADVVKEQEPAWNGPGLMTWLVERLRENARRSTALIAIVVLWAVLPFLTDGAFLTRGNLTNLFIQSSATAITAIAIVLVVVAGHMDLSVGSLLGFLGAVCAHVMVKGGWGVGASVLATLAAGIAVGAWHGFWVAYRRVPAFVVTLTSMLALRGLIIGITGGDSIAVEKASPSVTRLFQAIGQGYLPTFRPAEPGTLHDTSLLLTLVAIGVHVWLSFRKRRARIGYDLPVLSVELELLRLAVVSAAALAVGWTMIAHLGIPWCVLLVLALAVAFNFLARSTMFGRQIFAIGGNGDAARLSGIAVQRNVMYLFMLMGLMTAVAGVVYTSRLNAATASAGINAEMDAIAAAVLGGTSLAGGAGSIGGALLGALAMGSIDNGMSLMNLDVTYQYVTKGLILLGAVWLDMAQRRKS